MINLVMFDTEEDLEKLTGLDHDRLWDAGFNLDDWNAGFMCEKPLTRRCKEIDSSGNLYDYGVDEGVPGADWLVTQMAYFCAGYNHVEYKGKHYYTVHHA